MNLIIPITSKMEDPALYMPGSEDFTRVEQMTPRYKRLKNGEIVSLTLRITDQNNNIITNGPGTTVVLHIR